MFTAGHHAGRWIAKIFLSAICCSLLTVQSSYRFYQYANARHGRLVCPGGVTRIVNACKAGRAESARARLSFRSLDKRFELEPFFLLPVPAPAPALWVQAAARRCPFFATVLIGRSHPGRCLRGPPPIFS
ncbi:MAG TPA: hypothetical protein VKU83_09765 [Puia sp.]|nr:hypothetical protein [Puia sp.]